MTILQRAPLELEFPEGLKRRMQESVFDEWVQLQRNPGPKLGIFITVLVLFSSLFSQLLFSAEHRQAQKVECAHLAENKELAPWC